MVMIDVAKNRYYPVEVDGSTNRYTELTKSDIVEVKLESIGGEEYCIIAGSQNSMEHDAQVSAINELGKEKRTGNILIGRYDIEANHEVSLSIDDVFVIGKRLAYVYTDEDPERRSVIVIDGVD